MKILLASSIETNYFLRWDVKVGRAIFELYIEKPFVERKPPPAEISVHVEAAAMKSDTAFPESFRSLPEDSLRAIVEFKFNREHTAVYFPVGDPLSSGIRRVYIPFEIVPDGSSDRLFLAVEWIPSGPGRFRRQPSAE